jgi:hypothetical protein
MAGVLLDKQRAGNVRTISSPNINMTVMKIDQQTGK